MIIRDGVHGDINLQPELRGLIDTREFQRLRGIKQLGTADTVYITAVHTRFDHSLGTYHVASSLIQSLESKGFKVEKEWKNLSLIFALLHDITHIPFGHTFEDERRIFKKHDRLERYKIYLEDTPLGKNLEILGYKEKFYQLVGRTGDIPPFCYQLVAGTIGADLLDYLGRDAFFCGLESRYDRRILSSFEISDQGELIIDLEKKGYLRQDLLSEIINLLRIRYYLSERVYYHHAKIIAGAMLSRAVEALNLSLETLAYFTDGDLLRELDRLKFDSEVKPLIDGFFSRNLFKRGYMVSNRTMGIQAKKGGLIEKYHFDPEARSLAEKTLAEKLGISPFDIIVYCPPGTMFLKEADVPVRMGDGTVSPLSGWRNNEINVLLDNYTHLWKFYVFYRPQIGIDFARVSKVCEEFFTLENEFHKPISKI